MVGFYPDRMAVLFGGTRFKHGFEWPHFSSWGNCEDFPSKECREPNLVFLLIEFVRLCYIHIVSMRKRLE